MCVKYDTFVTFEEKYVTERISYCHIAPCSTQLQHIDKKDY